MAYEKNQIVPVTGRNIYIDDHNRTIYYNKKSKVGYVITQDKAPQFRSYSFRFGAGIGAAALFLVFNLPALLAVVFGLAVTLVLDYRFKHSYLESCTQITNFKPTEKIQYIETLSQDDEKKILIKIVLYFALTILLPLNSIQQKHETYILVIVSLIALGSFVMGINHIRALVTKKKSK